MTIRSFANKEIQQFFDTGKTPAKCSWKHLSRVALRKLDMLNYSIELRDLKTPPGNKLEPLKGNKKGYYSIRVNEQWRVVFMWGEEGAEEVDIMDYHK